MWLHEQYITAYPDLLDDFWDKQKDSLITAGGGVIDAGPPPAGPPPEEVSTAVGLMKPNSICNFQNQ